MCLPMTLWSTPRGIGCSVLLCPVSKLCTQSLPMTKTYVLSNCPSTPPPDPAKQPPLPDGHVHEPVLSAAMSKAGGSIHSGQCGGIYSHPFQLSGWVGVFGGMPAILKVITSPIIHLQNALENVENA
ncbi:uncharacterized protein LACBIDRAFT_331829 [Laccaria bicolor S238N-H82]|uniref:Predicted protein n=1 Tax=Laccaria bicolor (strain S238N-H82 / ATCC MYA-4686) TaxID=486041 RepID=B0DQP9_LACBS|nr:uncharacterized protein LACBIDRAFT_331829 [Laccaria bicolor S238N-H82]EDR03071.1 predicted protein [Laccaria bicolor S238N-H82]|eukprot:XP_001886212.1 predicted protein [Laccaria bicolor S238N-H82]